MPDKERTEILRRLNAVCEKLACLQEMIESGAPCSQILKESYRIQAELQAIKVLLLKCQIAASKTIIQSEDLENLRLVEFQRLFDLFIAINQSI
jgi:DNA-binding FrmR family transcriptional regulator